MTDPVKAGWKNFKNVTESVPSGHRLYRASAPNYNGHDDSSQNLTEDAVKFLVAKKIDSIISYNEYEYKKEEKDRLASAKPPIQYLHLKLGDFKPPTLAQLKQAYDFFLKNKSTLVHCGFGHGRTGTGVTGLQIYTEHGKNLKPLASSWVKALDNGGNNVEKRGQVSILAEQRNIFLPRVKGVPAGDPKHAFAVINFGSGFYLTLSSDKKTVISISPDKVETTSSIQQAYQWVITKDSSGDYTLSNKTAATNFALTKSKDAKVNDPVTYGAQSGGNTLFTIKEVATGEKGRYVISPKPNPTLVVATNEPDGDVWVADLVQTPALLASKDESKNFRLWILLTADFKG